ncbi:unnamed protein product, partial [Effrenium voratum]
MTVSGDYAPVREGDVVMPVEGTAHRKTTFRTASFDWSSVLPLCCCLLMLCLLVPIGFLIEANHALRGSAGHSEIHHGGAFMPIAPDPKPQVVAHIREYTYHEDAGPGDDHHFHAHDFHIHHVYHHDDGSLPPLRYDCMAGLGNWQAGWSEHKKQWCCTHDNPKYCASKVIDCSSHPS